MRSPITNCSIRWAACVVALLIPSVHAPLAAQTIPTVFRACYVVATGTVYRIGEPGLPTECRARGGSAVDDVEFSWTDAVAAVFDGDVAGGDLGGTFPDPIVDGLQGNLVSSADPADGQVLAWNGTTSMWTPASPPGSGGLTGFEIVFGDDVVCNSFPGSPAVFCGSIVYCPDGKSPINGGYYTTGVLIPEGFTITNVHANQPVVSDDGLLRGWAVAILQSRQNPDGTHIAPSQVIVRASVICVDGGP